MTATALITSLQVTVDGTELPDQLASEILSASVDLSVHLPDTFCLVFRDPARTILSASGIAIGSTVSLAVSTPGSAGEKLLEGAEVTALEAEYGSEGTLTVVRGMDKAFRAFSGRTVAAYKNATFSDAVKEVATRAGLTVGRVDATTIVHDNLTQNGVSDWSFIRGLARQIGYDAWVTDGKVFFCRPTEAAEAPAAGRLASTDPLQLTPKDDLRSFRCAVTAGQQVSEVTVRGWDPVRKQAVVGRAGAQSTSAANGASPSSLAAKTGNGAYLGIDVPHRKQDEADLSAKAIAETIGSAYTVFEGLSVGNPKLRAGTAISIGLLGEPFDGKYTLTQARHCVEPGGYTTWFSVTGRNERSLLGLTRPASQSAEAGGGRIPGVVIGIVTDNRDPSNECRVKLKFPWMSDQYESDWARNVQLWAGKGYGSVIVPEVGDEVAVAFEQGDIHRPFVLGGLYNGQDVPYPGTPELIDTAGAVTRRDLVSRTGHLMSMTEMAGTSDGITLKTAGNGYRLELSKLNRTVTLEADGTVVIEAKGTGAMTIRAAGDLDISGRRINIKAQSGITIDAGAGPADIKAGPRVGVQAAKVEVSGSAAADLKAGGMVTIQGGLVKIN